ncbi:hypothetical protein T02_11229 [Trichinella nativa]|uniref:Uncharacterized protein n=1 Tax=Trichinella nativa TaxID=6335 RepID=A0A0V1LQZ5_9BILA|nr:hypothetical protein T02_11229 [Trichinella nativa]
MLVCMDLGVQFVPLQIVHIAKGCQSEADNELWCRTVVVSIALLKPKSVDGSRRLCLHSQPSRILD